MTDATAERDHTGTWRPNRPGSAAPGRLDGLTEALLVGILYLAYELVRSVAPAREAVAFRNARAIQSVEGFLHLDVEQALNGLLSSHPALAGVISVYYVFAHETVALAVLVGLWLVRREAYPLLRNTLVTITLSSVVAFWMLPVAPPRLALAGTVDTVAVHPGPLPGSGAVQGLVNLYAAMPSLHVAWAVWCALAVVVTTRSTWRHLAWLYPATTTVVVLVTANHYILDVVAGALLAVGAWHAMGSLGRQERAPVHAGVSGRP